MDFLMDLKQSTVIISFTVVFIIVFVLLIITMKKLTSLRLRYTQMMNGGTAINVEQIVIGLQNNINEVTQRFSVQQMEVDQIKKVMRKMKSNLQVKRYNAFSEEGGTDLSFTIAILNDEEDGVVLTGIHGREQTFIYAKPVNKGQSTYNLSPEEKVLIEKIITEKSNA